MEGKREYNMRDQQYAYWLCNVNGIGNITFYKLWEAFGSFEMVYRASDKKLQCVLTRQQYLSLKESKKKWDVETEYNRLVDKKVLFYPLLHPEYPKKLRVLHDAPTAIYCIGQLPDEEKHSVAIIGARKCSAYGRAVAEEIAKVMVKANISVVSGMARGIDGIAQKAALEAGGETYGVLGSGVLVCYPAENRRIYDEIKMRGGILSEQHPYAQPKATFFPMRNRIISALSEVILVIEATEKSGTYITVDMALEQGKEVYAVPGRVYDPLSAGCNKMIEQGAGIITNLTKLPEQLFGIIDSQKQKEENMQAKKIYSAKENAILDALGTTPVMLTVLCERIKEQNQEIEVDLTQIRQIIMQMLLKGEVRAVGGSYFQRIF